MNRIVFLLFLLAFALSASAYNFQCRSRNGWSPGNGRYSYDGEWIDYFGVRAKAGEYVLFRYPNGKKLYWFPAYNCYEI